MNDFTNPLTYLVTAADGSTASYTVTVRVALKSEKAITSFSFSDLTCVIDETTRSITVTMPYGADISALVATFTTTGENVLMGGIVQKSGQTVNNFTNPVTYRVTAADKTTADYTVTVSVAPNSAKSITAFSLSGATGGNGVPGVIDEGAKSIVVTMPFAVNLTALAPAFSTTGDNVAVSGAAQSSGQTPNDFTNPLVYRVTAENGTTADYTVTVLLSSKKSITSFSVSGVSGVIDQPTRSITVTMPFATDITALAPAFVTTGEKVEVSGVKQSSGQTSNNFTNPLIYRVTAADASTLDYTVTVTLSATKAITAYSISGVSAAIDEAAKTIRVLLPRGTAVHGVALVATFATTGAEVKAGTVSQTSGVTDNNFTSSVIYTVTAADGTTATYTVTVTALFKLPDTGQTTSYTATFGEDHDYTINPPAYTDNGDGTVTDNVTGLMWQQLGDGLTYNWFQASGTADTTSNPGGAKDVCRNLTTGGHQDWRLPERLELASIVYQGSWSSPAINSSYFPGTKNSRYWSATTFVNNTSNAWNVYFYGGHVEISNKSNPKAAHLYVVRCVRGLRR